jgi:NADPH:quinone reductase-like Zn-dependent oxidoreductase
MKSAVLQKYRSDLLITESETKAIGKDQLRIKTAYAGLSFTDRIIQQGLYKYQRQHMPLPHVPGFEASGTIAEVGKNVTEFEVGDKVIVLQRSGCLSSEIISKPINIIKLLPNTDLAWAASLPVNFFTAAHALQNIVKIFPKSDILVTSSAGGVGGMLTQLGAKEHSVIGLVGNESKKQYVNQLGAREVYTYEEFFKSDLKFDVIFVASGKDLEKYQNRLKKNGKMIIYGFHSLVPRGLKSLFGVVSNYLKLSSVKPFNLVYENKTVSGFNIIHLTPDSNEFHSVKKTFLELLEIDSLPKNHKITEYDLINVNQALEELAAGATEGKIVIKF